MTQPLGSAGWRITGDDSSQDQEEPAYGNEFAQYWMQNTMDEAKMNKVSTKFRPTANAPRTGVVENFPIPNLTLGFDNGLSDDHSQWNQYQSLTQNINWQGSDAKSSFGSEYNFTVEELVNNRTNVFEAELVNDLPYSDFEDEPVRGGASDPQDAMGGLGESQPFDPGLEYFPVEAASQDNATSSDDRIATSSTIKPNLSSLIPNRSSFLELRPHRPLRRSNIPTTRSRAQPKCHPCDRCSSAFGRAGDLRRHYKVHFPDRRTFQCRIKGCDRNGQRGFYRCDKFRDHQRQAHGYDSESELVLLGSA
jgi:hypothetical protein